MNTKKTIKIKDVEALIWRKKVKNLHLNVLPPDGMVRITAPLKMNEESIRMFLASRISWVEKQRKKFELQERQTSREYVSGESHYFLGKRYRLEVIETSANYSVRIKGKKKIILTVKPNTSLSTKEKVIYKWYKDELSYILKKLIDKWTDRIGISVNEWIIKKMKTKWGTCNNKASRIWFNIELIKKPESSIEYIVVHELLHLLKNDHCNEFVELLDYYFPLWRSEKEVLNSSVLAHEEWSNI